MVFSLDSLGVMNADTPALNESEENARQNLVALCRVMLAGELSFFALVIDLTLQILEKIGVRNGVSHWRLRCNYSHSSAPTFHA